MVTFFSIVKRMVVVTGVVAVSLVILTGGMVVFGKTPQRVSKWLNRTYPELIARFPALQTTVSAPVVDRPHELPAGTVFADAHCDDLLFLPGSKETEESTTTDLSVRDPVAMFPMSSQVLQLFFDHDFDQANARNPACYVLTRGDSPGVGLLETPTAIGMQRFPDGFIDDDQPIIKRQVFLRFKSSLQNRQSYRLTVTGLRDNNDLPLAPVTFSFVYDEQKLCNPAIKVNQIGYLPDQPKFGYVSGFIGDLGGAAWAVGANGLILDLGHIPPVKTAQGVTDVTLRAVAATREDDVWVVGDQGTMIRFDGHGWNRRAGPATSNLTAIFATYRNEYWAVGENGTILYGNKGVWESLPSPTDRHLRGVWAAHPDQAWAVGDAGTILIWNGKTWTMEKSLPVNSNLLAIAGVHADLVWAVGENGTVLQRRHGKWRVFPQGPATAAHFRALVVSPTGDVLIADGHGVLWSKQGFDDSGFSRVNSNPDRRADSAANSDGKISVSALARQDERNLWVVGNRGLILKGDHQYQWSDLSSTVSASLHGVCALPAGPLRLSQPTSVVTITDIARGQPVLEVPLRLDRANWHLSGEDVFVFDLSALTQPGVYQAHVPGIGVSDPFPIDHDVWRKPAQIVARALFYQRCGMHLPETLVGSHARPVCHSGEPGNPRHDAVIHASVRQSPLYAGEETAEVCDVRGGWHDAGDYGKYIPTAAVALWHLLTAYELRPAAFPDNSLNIPESGNGIPDILDEARWELDWMCRMQHANGGVYHKVTTEKWFKGMPHQEEKQRFIYSMTTHGTALTAAILACAARIWKNWDDNVADMFMERAKRAWKFLQQHPEPLPQQGFRNPQGTVTGEYSDNEDADNRFWAAAELYRSTGDQEFAAYLHNHWDQNKPDWGWSPWKHVLGYGCWAYMQTDQPDVRADIRDAVVAHILRKAEESLSKIQTQPYGSAARLDVPTWIGWGAFSQSSEYAFLLLQAWELTNEKRFLHGAYRQLDIQFGANPLAMSFVTGLGRRSPRDPLHMPSIYDQVDTPVPGLPVFGCAAHLPKSNRFCRAAQSSAALYPPGNSPADPYPILRRYFDANQLVIMSEFTIVDIAITAGVLGVLADSRRQ